MNRSRLWWLAFVVAQITAPTVTAMAVAWPATAQDYRTPARPPSVVGRADIIRTRGYPLVWDLQHWYYDVSLAGELEGEGRSVGARHRMLPVLQLLLALTLPGTLFTIFRRRPAWPVRWVRVFFLTALMSFTVTLADIATEKAQVRSWNAHCSALGPLLQKPAVKEVLDWLADKREAVYSTSTYTLRGSESLGAWCLLFSLIGCMIVYRPWRRRPEPVA